MTKDDLDDLFAAARSQGPQPSPALMSRILADAVAEQPRPPTPARAAPRPRFSLAALVSALGGAAALAGLATAAVVGVWIGLAPPAAVDDLAASVWPSGAGDSVDLIPDLEGILSDADG